MAEKMLQKLRQEENDNDKTGSNKYYLKRSRRTEEENDSSKKDFKRARTEEKNGDSDSDRDIREIRRTEEENDSSNKDFKRARTEEKNGASDSERDIRGIRVITTRISLNEAEYLNIGSTISIINKKLMSADVKIRYFQQSLKVLQTQMLKDMRFNELLEQRKQELETKIK